MPRRLPEELTRKQMIDTSTGPAQRPQLLKEAGWYLHSLTKVIDSKTYVNGLPEPFTGVTLQAQTQKGIGCVVIVAREAFCMGDRSQWDTVRAATAGRSVQR